MIVNYKEDGWEIITQRSHGLLAAQFGAQWKKVLQPRRWVETLMAIAEHDDAENELDGENLLTSTGGPLNFDMKNFEPDHCKKLASLTLTKSRYIALLTSMHMDFLYRKEEDNNAGVKTFLMEQRRLQAVWRRELGLTKEEAQKQYAFLEWCDALSLLLCKGEMQPEMRRTEISTGPDNVVYSLVQTGNETITLEPWPFKDPAFEVYFESRRLKQIQFQSSEELRQAFLSAEVVENVWQVVKQKVPHQPKKKV